MRKERTKEDAMLKEKLLEVIQSPPDAALTIVSQGPSGPHLVNSWNSYIQIGRGGRLLIPAGGMEETEKNLAVNPEVQVSISNREVQGFSYPGTGFILTGKAVMEKEGDDYDLVKAKFPWARAALVISILSARQTL